MVSLKGHLAVKCSPLQIRHLTFLSLSLSFIDPASVFSSFASFLQFVLGLKMMFSPTDVVSLAGPAPSFCERPNFDQAFRSATLGFTTSLCTVNLMRRVVLTFLPSSLNLQLTMVLVPSLFVVVVDGGRASIMLSSSSSSSAQSGRLERKLACVLEAEMLEALEGHRCARSSVRWWVWDTYFATFDIM